MAQRKRTRQSRRRQQVRRQLLIVLVLIVAVVCAAVSCHIQETRHKAEAKAAVTTGQQKSAKEKKEKAKVKVETPKQKLKRVELTAKQKGYPDSVVGLLGKNKETVDFVEDYEAKKDVPAADNIGESYVEGQIPQLLQWDERWGYASYGTSIVAVSGCGPTCMAMVAAGLNKDPSITPAKVAAYGTENHYVDEDNNTYWAFMREAGSNWNLSSYEGVLTEEQVGAELAAGHPIICSVGPGDFTQNGHFIVLTGYENGVVKVNDPFSKKNSEASWIFKDIADQIKAMWVYSLKQ